MRNIKILFTDLDRTLLKDDNTLSIRNLNCLKELQEKQIITVIATGRNILSAKRVLIKDIPFNYLMFSSGAGIMDWKSNRVIYENHLNEREIDSTFKILLNHKVDFMLHDLIPENHRFLFWRTGNKNPDFERRIKIYRRSARSLELPMKMKKASQFIIILPEKSEERFSEIETEIKGLKVIRATSPLDHKSIWLEVFPKGVSKGHSAEWLCAHLKIKRENSVGIGNDFNDLDLLEWTKESYVVGNSPQELRRRFKVIKSNEDDGFAEVVESILTAKNTKVGKNNNHREHGVHGEKV